MKNYDIIKKIIDNSMSLSDLFNEIMFEESTHTYTIDGIKLCSVNDYLKKFVSEFDKDRIAAAVANKEGITVEEVLAKWNKVTEDGTLFHELAHRYYQDFAKTGNVDIAFEAEPNECLRELFEDIIEQGLSPFAAESRIYCKEYGLAGTPDLLLINKKTNKLIILDYKTNTQLTRTFGKKMKEPFNLDLESNLSKYKIQLSLYALMLENAGFEVEKMIIVHSRDNCKKYELELNYIPLLKEHFNKNITWLTNHL